MNDNALTRLRKKAMALPLLPGVYIMKDKTGKIIYIGKAKALKNRVGQYFGSQNNHSIKVRRMVEHVEDFDYIIVGSEFEALVLECSLIKLHTPKYNILLKDDKGYSYIKVEESFGWKRISAVKQKADDGAKYIGPYMSSDSVGRAVSEASRIFRLPTCGRVFPRDIDKARPCLNFHLKLCDAPCAGRVTAEQNNRAVDAAVRFITGGSEETIRELRAQMEQAAENLEFEKAAALRDTISSIGKTAKKQVVYTDTGGDRDVFAVAEGENKTAVAVLRFSGGRLTDSESFIGEEAGAPEEFRGKLLLNYYSFRDNIPPLVLLDGAVEDAEVAEKWLTEKRGKAVKLHVPERGEGMTLIKMAKTNAAEALARRLGRTGRSVEAVEELGRLLGMDRTPEYIESYDISHTEGAQPVAGMVVFQNGKPLKTAYKRFMIKSAQGGDDYSSLAEVISRRFSEYYDGLERGETEGFARLPDLILLDGGSGQVNAVRPVLADMGLLDKVTLFGMVKDSKHRTRAIATGGGEVAINDNRRAFTLVSDIQEEVHRYSIAYHRQRQSKEMTAMTLTEIPGIGKKTATDLLKHFKTLKAVREATVEELKAVEGIGAKTAESIYNYYRQ